MKIMWITKTRSSVQLTMASKYFIKAACNLPVSSHLYTNDDHYSPTTSGFLYTGIKFNP